MQIQDGRVGERQVKVRNLLAAGDINYFRTETEYNMAPRRAWLGPRVRDRPVQNSSTALKESETLLKKPEQRANFLNFLLMNWQKLGNSVFHQLHLQAALTALRKKKHAGRSFGVL